jgi:hypothetical protein
MTDASMVWAIWCLYPVTMLMALVCAHILCAVLNFITKRGKHVRT